MHKILYNTLWLAYFLIPVMCLEFLMNQGVLPQPPGAMTIVTLLPIYLALFFPFRAISNKISPEET